MGIFDLDPLEKAIGAFLAVLLIALAMLTIGWSVERKGKKDDGP